MASISFFAPPYFPPRSCIFRRENWLWFHVPLVRFADSAGELPSPRECEDISSFPLLPLAAIPISVPGVECASQSIRGFGDHIWHVLSDSFLHLRRQLRNNNNSPRAEPVCSFYVTGDLLPIILTGRDITSSRGRPDQFANLSRGFHYSRRAATEEHATLDRLRSVGHIRVPIIR